MLEHVSIDVSECIDTDKTDSSREYIFCHYWYFIGLNFRFQPKVCNGCYMTQKSWSFNDVATVTIRENDYWIHFWFMTKSEAMDRMKKADLGKKSGQI